MKLQIQVLSLAVLSALPLLASAQDDATALDQVLVTATRTPIALQDSISPAQVIDRAEIERSQAPSLQDLANKLSIQISAMTHALKPLMRDGLVELQPDADDRRTKRGVLTSAGAARLEQALVYWAKANQRVEEVLGPEHAALLRTLADQVASDEFLAEYEQG